MKPVLWRALALDDVRAAAAWYAQQGGLALELRFLDAVEAAVTLLGRHPAAGSLRHRMLIPDASVPLRFHPVPGFDRHLVYYNDAPEHVEIVRLWHAARGLDAFADTDPESPRTTPDPSE